MNDELRALRTLALVLLGSGLLRFGWQARVGAGIEPGAPVALAEVADSADRVAAEAELRSTPLGAGETIDPNRAGEVELDRLPGIGPALAERWIETRSATGGFRAPDDLLEIPGVGPSTLARIRPHLAPVPWERPPRLPREAGGS